MNKASLLLVLLLATAFQANAAALPLLEQTMNGQTVFLDPNDHVLWTNGDLFPSSGMSFSAAQTAVSSSTYGGVVAGTWRLPTLQEFNALFAAQGQISASGNGADNWVPLTVNTHSWYWTSNASSTNAGYEIAFSPFNGSASSGQEYLKTQSLGTWAVTAYPVAAVPEPATYALLLAGLCLVGAAKRRRKAPQA